MKKLLFIITLLFAFSLNASAQEQKVVTPLEKATADVADLSKLVSIESSLQEGFTKLFTMKYEMLQENLSDERKQILKQTMVDKIKGSLTPAQLAKLKAKKELYDRLTN
jgi:hypothetical protein